MFLQPKEVLGILQKHAKAEPGLQQASRCDATSLYVIHFKRALNFCERRSMPTREDSNLDLSTHAQYQ